MEGYTIAEEYELPSKGKIYDGKVNPIIRLRSMTTEEEMKRLNHSDSSFKVFSEIIDDCLLDDIGIKAYDLCVSDYQYLTHKLRVVTYGSDYPIQTICPICGKINEQTINLDSLKVVEYDEKLNKYRDVALPITKKRIKIRMQTPRLLDWVTKKAKEISEKTNISQEQSAFLYTIMSLIESVDGENMDEIKLEQFVRKLPMRDSNYILQCANKLNFGIDTKIKCKCKNCKSEYESLIPITGEFFGPSID